MEVEFNTKTAKIKSGTLVKYNNKGLVPCYYGISVSYTHLTLPTT